MHTKLITFLMLAFSIHIGALTCSPPVTLSNSEFEIHYLEDIVVNPNGDAAIAWNQIKDGEESLAIAHKIQSPTWSSPEYLAAPKDAYFIKNYFINSSGNILLLWKLADSDYNYSLQFYKKIIGEAWTAPLDLPCSSFDSSLSLDSSDNFISVNLSETPIQNSYNKTRTFTITRQSPLLSELTRDSFSLEEEISFISSVTLVNHKNSGYLFWEYRTYTSDAQKSLMCRKIEDGHFVGEPEAICALEGLCYDVQAKMNDNGDIVVAFEESHQGYKIITKDKNGWSQPFLFAAKEEKYDNLRIDIDNVGNIMAACSCNYKTIKTNCKAVDQPWMNEAIFSFPPNAAIDNVRVKADNNHNFVLVWEQEARNRSAIFGATFSTVTQTWSAPQLLSPKGAVCHSPSLGFSSEGKGYISWADVSNGFDATIQVAELSN